MPIVRTLSVMFIEFIRGVSLITLLFIASTMLNYFLPPGTIFDLVLHVLIMVTIFSAAYIAEVVRGGRQATPNWQVPAAYTLGPVRSIVIHHIALPTPRRVLVST